MKNLNEKGMLINLSISQWAGRKHDKTVSQEVASQHGTTTDAGRYHKSLVAKNALETIKKAANKARTFHYENTLPWSNDGARILPAKNYLNYSQKMRELKTEFETAVSFFIANYAGYVNQARYDLNGLFNPADYPEQWQIERKFGFETSVNPLPSADDFRVNINQEDINAIKSDIEIRLKSTTETAMRELWTRLHDAISHMVLKLKDSDAVFRDSLINNICELCGLLPRLNITDDPELEAMRAETEKALCGYDPDDLRKNPETRQNAAEEAQRILDQMSGYMGL